ncbi:MAG: lytic transglycosylase domain-containing protein [Clostridia bacterium]|nr:lytic transglycosylase domain-containing protein [Clostridia bacterium]
MKITFWRVTAFFLLIALSIGFGFAFDAAMTAIERKNYPIEDSLAVAVRRESEQYGIPEAILWATMHTGSGFASNHVSSAGAIGLMQLTPAQFDFICTEVFEKEKMDAGMLYDPATNLSAGSAYLSYLYTRYGVWEQVFAAYVAGTDTVDEWLKNPDCISPQGVLQNIPDKSVSAYVKSVKTAIDQYTKLYYHS